MSLLGYSCNIVQAAHSRATRLIAFASPCLGRYVKTRKTCLLRLQTQQTEFQKRSVHSILSHLEIWSKLSDYQRNKSGLAIFSTACIKLLNSYYYEWSSIDWSSWRDLNHSCDETSWLCMAQTKNDPFTFAGKRVAVVPLSIINLPKDTFGNLITGAKKVTPWWRDQETTSHFGSQKVSQVHAKQFSFDPTPSRYPGAFHSPAIFRMNGATSLDGRDCSIRFLDLLGAAVGVSIESA